MRSRKYWYSILILLTFNRSASQCLDNSDFATYNTSYFTDIGGYCPYWNTGGVANWTRSHGTPSLSIQSPAANNFVYLWAQKQGAVLLGEGIFGGFTSTASVSYTVTIKINVTDPGNVGDLRIYAATGLTQPGTPAACGGQLPTTSPSQLYQIAIISERNAGWKTYEYQYTPSSTFNQIWLFPTTTSSFYQYEVLVDFVKICLTPCLNTAIYNTGQIPTGTTTRGNIFLGSSTGTGGSGTVSVSGTTNTILVAANEIFIRPEFQATVSTAYFHARIDPCYNPNAPYTLYENYYEEENTIADNPDYERDDGPGDEERGFHKEVTRVISNRIANISPNPSTGLLTINLDRNKESNVTIELYNSTGNKLLRKENTLSNVNVLSLDLSSYDSGYYIIKVISKTSVYSQRVLILK